MSFWSLSDGGKPTGSAEDANTSASMIVPNNTMAKAKIMKFENVEMPSGDKMLVINWQLQDTNSRGIYVSQKLKVFDAKPATKDRAINMLVRLYKLANLQPESTGCPSNEELAKFKGRLMGIKIQQWFYQGKEGNWVSEVHAAEGFTSEDGVMVSAPIEKHQSMSYQQAEQAYSQMTNQNQKQNDYGFDNDVPF